VSPAPSGAAPGGGSSMTAMMKRRKLKLKAKFESKIITF
jgi:hypothetical protein